MANSVKPRSIRTGQLERVRHQNIGRMLFDAFRFFSERVLVHLNARGFTDLRPIHTSLLRNVDADGTRITALGERSSMTKQAVGQLIKECEELGYLRTRTDPSDARAKIVHYTPKGERFLAVIPAVLQAATEDIEAVIGARRMNSLAATLEQLNNRRKIGG